MPSSRSTISGNAALWAEVRAPAGNYTMIVRGVRNITGIAVAGAYKLNNQDRELTLCCSGGCLTRFPFPASPFCG